MTNSSPKRQDSVFTSSRLRTLSLFRRPSTRQRRHTLSGQRFESLEDRNLFAGDAFAAVGDSPVVDVEHVMVAPDVPMNPIAAAAPLGDEGAIELPSQLEQLRQQLGDEGFAHWLMSNEGQTGNRQGMPESQVHELEANDPEVFAEFQAIEQLLADWLREFEGNNSCPGDENCDGVSDEDQGLIDDAFRLRPEFGEALIELGEPGLVFQLESNNVASGNYQNIDLIVIEDWQNNFPILFQEFEIVELGLQTWLENVDLGNQPCPSDLDCNGESAHELPPVFEQLRLEIGDEAFAEWLVNNQQQSGNLQNVAEADVDGWRVNNPEAFAEFEMTEQVLQAWLDWFENPSFQVLDIFVDGSSWDVSEFLLPSDPSLDVTLPWIGLDQVVVTFTGAQPLIGDLTVTHGLVPIQVEIPAPGVAVWTLPVDAGLGTIGGFSPGGIDDFGINVGGQMRMFDVVPGDVDGLGHLTDIGDILDLFDPLNPNGIGFATETPVRSDVDGSGLVDIGDLLQIVNHLGSATLPPQPAAASLAAAAPLGVDEVFAEVDDVTLEAPAIHVEKSVGRIASRDRGLGQRTRRVESRVIESQATEREANEIRVVDSVFASQAGSLVNAI